LIHIQEVLRGDDTDSMIFSERIQIGEDNSLSSPNLTRWANLGWEVRRYRIDPLRAKNALISGMVDNLLQLNSAFSLFYPLGSVRVDSGLFRG
jgi:hypothetical protein